MIIKIVIDELIDWGSRDASSKKKNESARGLVTRDAHGTNISIRQPTFADATNSAASASQEARQPTFADASIRQPTFADATSSAAASASQGAVAEQTQVLMNECMHA
jgi:hypothetical protein